MQTNVDQIADRIYRLSTWIPEIGPGGFTFNQFLVDAEEPLLYHTGMRQLFPLVKEAVERIMPVARLRWIAFAHLEADECGAVNEFLSVAPHAEVAHGELGVQVSLSDQCARPPRPLADGEVLDIGGAALARRMVELATPHAVLRGPLHPARRLACQHRPGSGRGGLRGRGRLPADIARPGRPGGWPTWRPAGSRSCTDPAMRAAALGCCAPWPTSMSSATAAQRHRFRRSRCPATASRVRLRPGWSKRAGAVGGARRTRARAVGVRPARAEHSRVRWPWPA